jgi:hypothetical protein
MTTITPTRAHRRRLPREDRSESPCAGVRRATCQSPSANPSGYRFRPWKARAAGSARRHCQQT